MRKPRRSDWRLCEMEKKLYKGFSIFFVLFGMFSFFNAFFLFLEPSYEFEFYLLSISGSVFFIFHRYIARMFAFVLTPIIKFCIFIIKD